MINSRSLILFTALVAYAPAASYGFLTTVKCTNVSDACANVPEMLPNQALRPNLASMRDPHELHSHRGVDSLRQSSWQLDHLFDSDMIQAPSQGDVASSALAWAKRLVHIAGPSCPYGYSVTLGSYSAASADNVKALVLDQRFLLENRTPTRGPLSGVLLSKSTALLIPPRDNTDVMVGRRITASTHRAWRAVVGRDCSSLGQQIGEGVVVGLDCFQEDEAHPTRCSLPP